MKKEDKAVLIEKIKETLASYSCVYLTETTGLNSERTTDLRRAAFKADVKMLVVKNTLLKKAMEASDVDYSGLYPALVGNTTLMLSNTGNAPAKLLKDFRQKKETQPALKAAFVEEAVYMGPEQLDTLVAIKSKNELCSSHPQRTLSLLCSQVAASSTEFSKHYQTKNNKKNNNI